MAADKSIATVVLKLLVVGLAIGLLIGIVVVSVPLGKGGREAKDQEPVEKESDAPVLSQKILALYSAKSELYVSQYGAGILKTEDGEKWTPLVLGLNDPKAALSIEEIQPTMETLNADLAATVEKTGRPPDAEAVKSAMMNLSRMKPGILAGMQDGRVMKLEGDTWQELSRLPADGGGVYRLRFHPVLGLLACTGRGLHLSKDGGRTWKQIYPDVLTRDVVVAPEPPNRILLGLFGGGLFRCDADGSCRGIPGAPKMVRRMVSSKTSMSGFIVTDGEGLWGFEGERLFQISSRALDNADMLDIVASGPRIVVAAGPDGVLIRDASEGGWYPGAGLPPDSVNAVAMFKEHVYVGTNRYGLFAAPIGSSQFKNVLE
jgi:hypothetical protein